MEKKSQTSSICCNQSTFISVDVTVSTRYGTTSDDDGKQLHTKHATNCSAVVFSISHFIIAHFCDQNNL
jgi:hypothetical protein